MSTQFNVIYFYIILYIGYKIYPSFIVISLTFLLLFILVYYLKILPWVFQMHKSNFSNSPHKSRSELENSE